MHKEVMDFVRRVKSQHPQFFKHAHVLECGSANLNGSPRELFTNCQYVGLDLKKGPGVTTVCKTHQYKALHPFDVVISCEMLEHDPWWDKTLRAWRDRLLRPGGLLIITCAGPLRAEHGTAKAAPEASPALSGTDEYRDYYHNISYYELERILGPMQNFPDHSIEVRRDRQDLYFWGIKKL